MRKKVYRVFFQRGDSWEADDIFLNMYTAVAYCQLVDKIAKINSWRIEVVQ